MARIAGIDLPKNKRGEIGLTYIYGIGRSTAQKILAKAEIDFSKKVQDWNDEEQNKIRTIINEGIKVEGALRSAKLETRLLLQVHDELIFEVAAGEEDRLSEMVRQEMESAVELSLPLSVNIGTGLSWDLAAH